MKMSREKAAEKTIGTTEHLEVLYDKFAEIVYDNVDNHNDYENVCEMLSKLVFDARFGFTPQGKQDDSVELFERISEELFQIIDSAKVYDELVSILHDIMIDGDYINFMSDYIRGKEN